MPPCVGSFAQYLASSVRERRNEVGLIKALGFTRLQVAATVAWQATVVTAVSIIIGFPLGAIGGRLLWSAYAHQVSGLARPIVPFAWLALAGAVGIVAANLVAGLPALTAARLPIADVLHDDAGQ